MSAREEYFERRGRLGAVGGSDAGAQMQSAGVYLASGGPLPVMRLHAAMPTPRTS